MATMSDVAVEKRPRGRPRGSGHTKGWTTDNPPPRIARFVEWYTHERAMGQTHRDYARDHEGGREATVSVWMRDPRVLALLDERLRASNAGPVKVQQVLEMLHKRATVDEDVRAARTYLEAVDRLIPKSRLDIVHHDARSLSDEQLHAELRRAIALMEGRTTPALPEPIEEAEVIDDQVVGLSG